MKRQLVILGAGESGVGAAVLGKKQGYRVFVSDKGSIQERYKTRLLDEGIEWEEGQHSQERILLAEEIIKSPGIPNTAPMVQLAMEAGIPVISEIEFAGRYTQAKMLCITGSNGKTTTATCLHHILSQAGLRVGLAGNVGSSLAMQVAENDFDYYVLELSSFQLDNMFNFRAHVAILLNITPDHLDRYNYQMQNYVAAKMRILQNQTPEDVFIYWYDDPWIQAELQQKPALAQQYPFALEKKNGVKAYTENKQLVVTTPKGDFIMEEELLALTGSHNVYNSLAAALVAKLEGLSNETIKLSLHDFKGVEHRLEKVAIVKGVQYINDSKATNVNSCWYALKSMKSKVVLILGGTDKGNDYSEIEELVVDKCRALIFLGVDNTKLRTYFGGKLSPIVEAGSMQQAVAEAYRLAQKGDTVLLSPSCASFDLFENYEDRGKQFKHWVRKL